MKVTGIGGFLPIQELLELLEFSILVGVYYKNEEDSSTKSLRLQVTLTTGGVELISLVPLDEESSVVSIVFGSSQS